MALVAALVSLFKQNGFCISGQRCVGYNLEPLLFLKPSKKKRVKKKERLYVLVK